MTTVMDMSTGKTIDDEFGNFEFEVMNAEWLPTQAMLQLGLQTVDHHETVAIAETEVEAYLAKLYRFQS